MQTGQLVKRSGSWYVKFHIKTTEGWRSKAVRLCTESEARNSGVSVRELADNAIRRTDGTIASKPTCLTPLSDFIADDFLIWLRTSSGLKWSTVDTYHDNFRMLKPHLGKLTLSELDSRHVQQILNSLARTKPRSSNTYFKAKSFLGAVWNFAKIERGLVNGADPVDDSVKIPKGTKGKKKHAYTLQEIYAMLAAVEDPTLRTAMLVAAFTGLRCGEIEGLKWEDFDGKTLTIRRDVYKGHIQETPKTDASAEPVPLISIVAEGLNELRNESECEWIFAGQTKKPMRLEDAAPRRIRPVLKEKNITWHGWHSFRHGVGSNLHALGIDLKTISAILRHAKTQLTMDIYTTVRADQSLAALEKLSEAYKKVQQEARARAAGD